MRRGDNGSVKIRAREKSFADDFYVSQAWIKCARAYKRSVSGLCERCRAQGKIVPCEEVHHKIKLTPENIKRPEVALNWANLIALCKDCHMEVHRKPKRWRVDADGNVTPGE